MHLALPNFIYIIYFSFGALYLILDYIVSNQKYVFYKHISRLFVFVFLWPIILSSSVRLYFKIGKYLKSNAKWKIFFTTKKSSVANSLNSELFQSSVFFDENHQKPPF